MNVFVKENKDIANGKRKVVLSVMWQLIREHSAVRYDNKKDQLLKWIQRRIPSLQITNLTTDWNDGKAIGALVNTLAQG